MLLIAHRGISARFPENSIQAFEAAIDAGAQAVEFDIRLTWDGELVVTHDDDVSRGPTAGTGRVSQMEAGRAHELGIPPLSDVLSVLAGRTRVFAELKGWFDASGYHSADAVARAAASVLRAVPELVVSSFDPAGVAAAREVLPGVPTGLGGLAGVDLDVTLHAAVEGEHEECHISHQHIDRTFVQRAHAAGRRVMAWTVNEPARMRALRDMGADGVFTDDIVAARAALDQH